MKTVVGKVVQINMNTQIAKKDGGGSYPGWQLIYATLEGKIETIAKHINSLKRTPSVAAGLNSLAANDDFTMELEKGEAGFWEVISVRKGADMPDASDAGTAPVKASWKSDKTPSTYETPEERALRQLLIVRQSAVSSAIAATPGGEMKTILKNAEKIEEHVWRGFEVKRSQPPVTTQSAPEVE